MAAREARREDTAVLAQAAHRRGCRHRADRRGGADHRRRGRCLAGWRFARSGNQPGHLVHCRRCLQSGRRPRRGRCTSSRSLGHRPATLQRCAERHSRDSAYDARPASAEHLRAWPHGLAEDLGYNWRALVEADISHFKRVIGDGLRSRTDHRRATEVAIAVKVLNRMLELGRPEISASCNSCNGTTRWSDPNRLPIHAT